jgi:phosphoglycerate dehydrogenase-like enzyme
VVVLSPLSTYAVKSLLSAYLPKTVQGVDIVSFTEPDREAIKRELSDADVVIGDYTFRVGIDRELVEAMGKVKLIQQPSTGFNHIDIEACALKGIPVANVGGANAVSVAEHTITAALVLMKHIFYAHMKMLDGKWVQSELMNVAAELHDKNWGLVGAGRIGREVAKKAKGLGSHVLYYDRKRMSPTEEKRFGAKERQLDDLLMESDVVSIHLPLTSETRGLIGEARLRMMKPNAVLVNPSRGEIVDEAALAKAVLEGWIMGASVDVYSQEPPPPEHPLILAAREGAPLILTPHIAGATNEARLRIIKTSMENVARALTGQALMNVVNM